MKSNSNIIKTLLLIVFVLLGQVSLLAQKANKIYEEGKYIHFVKDNKRGAGDTIKALYNDELIKEIDVRPGDSLSLYFEVKPDKGYNLKFPLDRGQEKWLGSNTVKEDNKSRLFNYILTDTESYKDSAKTTIKIDKEHQGGFLRFTNAETPNDTVLTINVLKAVEFDGLYWNLRKDDNDYFYFENDSLNLVENNINITLKNSDKLEDDLLKLATFSIKNNTSDTITWQMPENNNLSTVPFLQIYPKEESVPVNGSKNNVEVGKKEYFIGVLISNIEEINAYNKDIIIKFKTAEYNDFGSVKIPNLNIEIENGGLKVYFASFKWWQWLLFGVLIIVLLLLVFYFIFKPGKGDKPKVFEGEGKKLKKKSLFRLKKDNGRRKQPETQKAGSKETSGENSNDIEKQIVNGEKSTLSKTKYEKKEQQEELLKIILQSIIIKFGDSKSKDIDSFIKKIVADTNLLPESLNGKTTLLNNYIYKDEKEVGELNKFLEEYEKKRVEYRKENQEFKIDKLSDISTSLEELNTLYKELGLSRGSVQEDAFLFRDIKIQFGGLKKHDSFSKLELNENNFAGKIINEIEMLKEKIKIKNREIEDKKNEYQKQLNQLIQEKKSELDAVRKDKDQAILQLKEEHESATINLKSKLESYTKELEARNLDYISSLLFCVEELSRVYTDILKASKTSKMVDEMIKPVLVGDNNTGGLKAFINKLKNRDVLLKSLKLGKESWADLKVEETKAAFVKEITLGNDFLSTVDLISTLYVYSKINFGGVNVTNDLLGLNIKPTEIEYAYKILNTTLKHIFDIDIKLYNLFDDVYDESIHQLSSARRFSNLSANYVSLHNKTEARKLVDMLSVGLVSNIYKEANKKAQVTYK